MPESAWAQIERIWFVPTAPPLLQRAAAARWTPDTPHDFCPRCFATRPSGVTPSPNSPRYSAPPCSACEGRRLPWDHAVRLGEFVNPLDTWIHELKFTRFRAVGLQLGQWLGERVDAAIDAARAQPEDPAATPFPPGPPLVVPIPTTRVRRWTRGIDHARVLADGVAQTLRAPVVHALARAPRPSQRDIAPSDRPANVRGMFKPSRDWRGLNDQPHVWVIVDDVTTTGSTLAAAARAIRLASPLGKHHRIWVAAVAWTPLWRRNRQES